MRQVVQVGRKPRLPCPRWSSAASHQGSFLTWHPATARAAGRQPHATAQAGQHTYGGKQPPASNNDGWETVQESSSPPVQQPASPASRLSAQSDSGQLDDLVSGFLGKVQTTGSLKQRHAHNNPSHPDASMSQLAAHADKKSSNSTESQGNAFSSTSESVSSSPRLNSSTEDARSKGALPSSATQQPPQKQHDAKQVKAALTRLLAKQGAGALKNSFEAGTSDAAPSAGATISATHSMQPQPHRASAKGHAPSSSGSGRRVGSTQQTRMGAVTQRSNGGASGNRTSPEGARVQPQHLQHLQQHQHQRRQQRPPSAPSPPATRPSTDSGIQLPPGPEWTQARRSFRPAPGNASLPRLSSIVLVEGHTDCNAVQRAVDTAVYVVGGSGIMTKQASEQLKRLAGLGHDVVVLTDPDREGNVLRDHLDNLLGSAVKHAFVPPALATSVIGDDRHEEGNVGVEHAAPDAIRTALAGARPSHGSGRKEFSVEILMSLGLVNSFDSREVVGAKLQRALLCEELGVGQAGGAALAKLLNRYFTREQFDAALKAAKQRAPTP